MTILPVLNVSCIAFGVLFLALHIYRSTITRYEDEKLFLDGNDTNGEQVQTEIIRKINRLQPFVTFIGAATGIISASILGVHVYRAILVLQS